MQIYNSLTQQKEPFKPIKAGEVSLYVCGVTVYDHCHIGHARTNTTFDIMVRYFKWRGYQVTYVRNITDIDDKIIKRAHESGLPIAEVVKRFTATMHEDFARLNLLPPDLEPKATETIMEMITLIQDLIAKGFAYAADNGDVYYDIAQFSEYGKLSKQHLNALQAGARVAVDEAKKSPLDFVLWKAAKPDEPSWPSPWGVGRPGWHLECSAMTQKCLGIEFDIHGGGSDLKFPHHENEIAQSEAVHNGRFAHYWAHSAMVQVGNEKMSKSLGNFFTIREVLQHYPAEVVRYFLIAGHYRSDISYSEANLKSAQDALHRLYQALARLQLDSGLGGNDSSFQARFQAAMDDDFNTPQALAVLFDLAREINRYKEQDPAQAQKLGVTLKTLGGILGILQGQPETFLQGDSAALDITTIEHLIAQRLEARRQKDFSRADAIRAKLDTMNIVLEDTGAGTTWRKK